MTREEAIDKVLATRSRILESLREEKPQWLCDRLEQENAEDCVDIMVAFGLIKLDDAP